jgi:triosephosphate isomerase
MNMTAPEGRALVDQLLPMVSDASGVDVVVCPPFTTIASVVDGVKSSDVAVGAQDMYWEDSGAYTGQIAPQMLLTAGCTWVIIGHSERRQFFGETNDTVARKVAKAFEVGLKPIMCVGENLEEREAGCTEAVVEDHVRGGLAGLSSEQVGKLVVAYEPVWAIGTGMTATKQQAQDVHAFIRKLLAEIAGDESAEAVRIQYGGSVKPDNAVELFSEPDIDGGLIGGAALKADDFAAIVNAAA